MNNSTSVPAPNTAVSFVNSISITCGALAIVGNILLIAVTAHTVEYFKRSAFLFGLALGDLVNGVALMMSAIMRTLYQTLPASELQVRPTYCMLTLTPYWIIGNQATSLMLLIIGAERFVAVQFFAWYRVNWTKKLSWICTGLVYVFCLFSIGVAYYLTSIATATTSINCYFIGVVGKAYNFYNYSVSILAGFAANIGTLLSLILCLIKLNRFRRHPQNTSNTTVQAHIKKQWHLTKTMIGCTVCDLGLVIVPNILMFMVSSLNIDAAAYGLQNVTTYAPPLLCIKGFLNLFCCLLFNPEFRRNVLYLTRLGKNTNIVPISLSAANLPHVKNPNECQGHTGL